MKFINDIEALTHVDAARKAQAEMSMRQQEFLHAVEYGEWERAAKARDEAVAFFEAHLDAMSRAWRRVEQVNGGP